MTLQYGSWTIGGDGFPAIAWTDVPGNATEGTFEGTVEVRFPRSVDKTLSGRPCAAIGLPKIIIESPMMTGNAMSFWQGFFSASSDTTASIILHIFNPRSAYTGSAAWVAACGLMSRPTFSSIRPGSSGSGIYHNRTYYESVSIVVSECEFNEIGVG